eukprot:jgi/Mesen1/10636/ME000894S10205
MRPDTDECAETWWDAGTDIEGMSPPKQEQLQPDCQLSMDPAFQQEPDRQLVPDCQLALSAIQSALGLQKAKRGKGGPSNKEGVRCILVMGAGDATGGAIARRFAEAGYVACLVRRRGEMLHPIVDVIKKRGGRAYGFGVDARNEEAVQALFEKIERSIGPVEVAVFNIGANVRFDVLQTTSRVYYKVWQMACFAGFLTGREAAKHMTPRGRGTILFTGATASVRGGAGFAAFAGAKFGLRALAQSMARELGPRGIHVAHVVVDAPIDTEWTAEAIPDMESRRGVDGVVAPEHVAELYFQIHMQHRSAWVHEADVRPWVEKW